MLLSTRRERRLEGLLIAASAVGLALLANHCVPDVQVVENEPDAGLGGAGGEAGANTGGASTGGSETGTPGLIDGPCLEDDICTVGRCAANGRCVSGEYGDPCEIDDHCFGGFCDLSAAGAGGAGGQSAVGTCG